MEQIITYVFFFMIIVIIGHVFNKSKIPIGLLLVITGILLSLIPKFPDIVINPTIVLNIFLPLLVYEISALTSWIAVKKNIRPIILLSFGHVIFITILVAIVVHYFLPQLGWAMAFLIGAVVSPPDDVAIVAIAEKIRMPSRVLTILEGEALFNDATALILFRFALAAVVTHQFFLVNAVSSFILVVIGETAYGLLLGFFLTKIRLKIRDPMIKMLASLITPFIAYIPPVLLGGCGVLATAITGFIIGNVYALRIDPEFRLISRTIWPTIAYTIQNLIFLLIGLSMRGIFERISLLTVHSLLLYSSAVVGVVIVGRFIWVFVFVYYLPRRLFPSILKRDPYPPWQFPFLISWSGMRGGISLAAALAVPATLPLTSRGINPQDILIFLVFSVILATLLLQGLTLPWVIKAIGIHKLGLREKYSEHIAELQTRVKMAQAATIWLKEYQRQINEDEKILLKVKSHLQEFKMLKRQLKDRIKQHGQGLRHDEKEEELEEGSLLLRIIDIERQTLLELWRKEKINLTVRDKLLERLDHQSRNVQG